MSLARLTVRAVVVSDGLSGRLASVLDALAAQDPAPDHVDLVLAAGATIDSLSSPLDLTVHSTDASSVGGAVAAALAAAPGEDGEMLWILHDDSAPLPGALAALSATARKRRRAEVIGAAQVRWDDASRLVSLGTTTTRLGARRVTLVDEDDVYQGQYDARDDVLAVSLAGALVRRDTWERLEGLEPAYDGWGDSLDFCRRVWRSGGDVVVVPQARIRHAQERLYGVRDATVADHTAPGPRPSARGSRRDTYAARRAAEWLHALIFARWWALPVVVAALALSTVWRAIVRVVRNDGRMLAAELAVPFRVVGHLPSLWPARGRLTRTAGRGRAARATERALLATGRQVRHDIRVRSWGEYETWRAASAPSDVVRTELEHSRRRTWRTFAVLAAAMAAVTWALHGDWIWGVVRGQMLVGDTLGVTDGSVGELWDRALGGWTEQALGAPSIDAGLAPLLMPLAVVPGGLAVGLGLLVAAAPLWAALAAWAAAGAVTRSLVFRVIAAAAYALVPTFLVAIDEGRVAAVTVHVLAPLVLLGILRAGGWHRGERVANGEHFPERTEPSLSAGMAAAVALAMCVIAAPLLAVPAIVAAGVLAVIARGCRLAMLAVAIPTLAVALPGFMAAIAQGIGTGDAWSILAREPGPSAPSSASALDLLLDPWQGVDGIPGALAPAGTAFVLTVLVAVALAVLGGRRWPLTAAGIVLMGTGISVAIAQSATVVSPDAGVGTSVANGWAGPGLTWVALGALLVVGAGLDGAWRVGSGATRVAVRIGAGALAAAIAVAAAGHVTALVWPGREDAATVALGSRDVIPLVAALEQRMSTRERVLMLDSDGGEVTASVLAGDGTEVVSTAGEIVSGDRAAARTVGDPVVGLAALDESVAWLLGGASGAGHTLANWGIGVVVAAPGADTVAEALAQSPDLALLGSSDRGTSWRVQRADEAAVSRAWVETDTAVVDSLAMGRSAGSGDIEAAGTLFIAVADDPAWTASLDGEPLTRVDDELGRVAFDVPAAGHVHVAYDDSSHRFWSWVAVAAAVWAALGAIPVRARGFKEARS